ncbi:hypothetical protein [Pseudovibrio sp. JE062]|uniref:hypothetical protein n=1 Tax=Pseudovibrio sp. JE062 TaxID=439495 RepID=UPI000186B788|nr:hypothetical protein [Pseudovibrio sp. JE062]EEA92013.1 hypothetical protein PJE062_2483 [Pseudovibrio sp. JE062]
MIWDSLFLLVITFAFTGFAELLIIGRNAEGYFRFNKLARVLLFAGAMAVSFATTLWVLLGYGFADPVMYRANGYMAFVAVVSSSFLSYLALYLIYKFVEDIFN